MAGPVSRPSRRCWREIEGPALAVPDSHRARAPPRSGWHVPFREFRSAPSLAGRLEQCQGHRAVQGGQ
ncbi:hypothetical protein G6F21_014504 [Rhizopus arrhizus]|uniref:Uncharacterized protein n=1 Tax=Rhizopus oryzae TaxID=64495 RepID=A0A9P6WQR4_RHIOR|nr:hypothetical protein G6F21_014504 [Rhizopus arrhizus]KAG1270035.1 hypothetical protein G6F64_015656 [Rhizopus arrhizus]